MIFFFLLYMLAHVEMRVAGPAKQAQARAMLSTLHSHAAVAVMTVVTTAYRRNTFIRHVPAHLGVLMIRHHVHPFVYEVLRKLRLVVSRTKGNAIIHDLALANEGLQV